MSIMNNLITLSRNGASPEILEAYRKQGADAGDRLAETLDELVTEIESYTDEVGKSVYGSSSVRAAGHPSSSS